MGCWYWASAIAARNFKSGVTTALVLVITATRWARASGPPFNCSLAMVLIAGLRAYLDARAAELEALYEADKAQNMDGGR